MEWAIVLKDWHPPLYCYETILMAIPTATRNHWIIKASRKARRDLVYWEYLIFRTTLLGRFLSSWARAFSARCGKLPPILSVLRSRSNSPSNNNNRGMLYSNNNNEKRRRINGIRLQWPRASGCPKRKYFIGHEQMNVYPMEQSIFLLFSWEFYLRMLMIQKN